MHWDVIVPRSPAPSPVRCRLLPVAVIIERMPEPPANLAATGSGWNGWTAVVLLASLPFVVTLGLILWRTPVPLTEAVAIARSQPKGYFVAPVVTARGSGDDWLVQKWLEGAAVGP